MERGGGVSGGDNLEFVAHRFQVGNRHAGNVGAEGRGLDAVHALLGDNELFVGDDLDLEATLAPCAQYGERVEAAVRLSENSAATAEELRTLCIGRVGDFKAPDQVHILDELPKGPSGKIQRLYLNELLYGKG